MKGRRARGCPAEAARLGSGDKAAKLGLLRRAQQFLKGRMAGLVGWLDAQRGEAISLGTHR